jgi:hypothetical protein
MTRRLKVGHEQGCSDEVGEEDVVDLMARGGLFADRRAREKMRDVRVGWTK